ncbi:bacillithiol biosynthesis cysteine-adding enzyme BshC [Gracilibacillus halotolerans]|uniref:Putative cysteine ligase BshC n=1 Tax=Gracilibacillus halotolerans TaxID=74386 RepID=A0A841RIN8_9BACI|nr:bacillithiol biosynthesis cysteine-adding enzyme BshC [Gracilibacillus halotolerans]MBB6511346.1 bacillithiol biosynthesis cysteine-adding enzyme BshC [Gracilibacillus halotolerans]
MVIEPLTTKWTNPFIKDYIQGNEQILNFYDYSPYSKDVFRKRKEDLDKLVFERDVLTDVLMTLNKNWNADNVTLQNIERLEQKNSLVVIGGQQAGLLTGPMLSIHKIISIISLSKQQEKELGVPVIPVFWIAGEDHDYDEINHVFLPKEGELTKHIYPSSTWNKLSISERTIIEEELKKWVHEAFRYFEETEHTYDLYNMVDRVIEQSHNLVDFFAQIIHWLFKETGLVLIDSGNSLVRKIESNLFIQMIEKQPAISQSVYTTLENLRTRGYSVSVEVEEDDAHLFYHLHGERILLKRKDDKWIGKNQECELSTEELIEIAKTSPERLSNNVVTRPLMQEMLFPTLAFYGGMSEVAYWGILKGAFHHLDMKMPPVLPRTSFTWIERKVERYLDKYGIPIEQAIMSGVDEYKMNWLKAQLAPPLDLMIDEFKESIKKQHQVFQDIAASWRPDMENYAEKNLEYILQQTENLRNQFHREQERDYSQTLNEFDYLNAHLYPNNGFQERSWNIFYFLNRFGVDKFRTFFNEDYSYKQLHYVIKL